MPVAAARAAATSATRAARWARPPLVMSPPAPMRSKERRAPGGGHELEAELVESPSRLEAPGLVPIGEGQEHRALRREAGAGRDLALGERETGGRADAHHLAGGAHLGAEQGVDAGEAVERQHGFLHAHPRSPG